MSLSNQASGKKCWFFFSHFLLVRHSNIVGVFGCCGEESSYREVARMVERSWPSQELKPVCFYISSFSCPCYLLSSPRWMLVERSWSSEELKPVCFYISNLLMSITYSVVHATVPIQVSTMKSLPNAATKAIHVLDLGQPNRWLCGWSVFSGSVAFECTCGLWDLCRARSIRIWVY
jgi:hypothetical protein